MRQALLETLVSSSVLIVVLAALRAILRGKISPRLQYGLWLLAALRLLVPVSIGSSPASVMNYVPQQAMEEVLHDAAIPAQLPRDTQRKPAYSDTDVVLDATTSSAARVQEMADASEETSQQRQMLSALQAGYLIWAAGAFLTVAAILGTNWHLSAKLKRSRRRLNVPDYPLSVYITYKLRSACLFGLFRPVIYLTPQACNADDTPNRYVLLHELTHYRRHDQIWCALRLLCTALYWFDPFVWLAAHLSKLDCELACDEAALRDLDDGARLAYGRTLLDQISARGSTGLIRCATTMAQGKRSLRARIRLIVKKPRMTGITLAFVVGICCVLAACTFTNGKQNTSSGSELPDMVQLNGTLYQLTQDGPKPEDAARVETAGTIKSYVNYTETPLKDEQTNFPANGREYGVLDGQMVLQDSLGQWKFLLMNLPSDEVDEAVLRYLAPETAEICNYYRCRTGTLVAAKRTNADASLDALVLFAQKVDGSVQVTQTETGRFGDEDGFGIYQAEFAGQTVVFGIADRRVRETATGNTANITFNGVSMHTSDGSTSVSAEPGAAFLVGAYDAGEVASLHLTLGSSGDAAVFSDIPKPDEGRSAKLTLAENWADTLTEQSGSASLTEAEMQAIRQAAFDKLDAASWDSNLTEDEIRSFTGADSRENGTVGNYPNFYGVFADYFVETGRAPGGSQTWSLSLPDEQILALTAEENGETLQRLYYSRKQGTLCGMRQEPLLTEDMPIGIGVQTDYADENFVIFHGYFGLFVYDLQRENIDLALDLSAATGSTNLQGSFGNQVLVRNDAGTQTIMLIYYNDVQGGLSPYSYYISTTGRVRFEKTQSPDAFAAATQYQAPVSNVMSTGNTLADLTYSDGVKTWRLFENWHFGERSNAVFLPLTSELAEEQLSAQEIGSDDFYELFWELDRDSMENYLSAHPEALADGWAGININEAGFDQSGTSIRTTMGEQVLAVNYRQKALLVRVEGENYRGVLAIAKVPARVSIEMSEGIGSYGQLAGEIAQANNGILAMTCNGFLDPDGKGNGGELAGYAMSDGVSYGAHYPYYEGFPYYRMELHTDHWMSIKRVDEPVDPDCRDAIEFQPPLIIDGEILHNESWVSENPRACIGQSDRGEILMLVIEGRMPEEGITGTGVNECAAILARHNAVQAMNVDGGTSAILWYDGQYVTRCSNPAIRYTGGRALPNAFIYHKRTE